MNSVRPVYVTSPTEHRNLSRHQEASEQGYQIGQGQRTVEREHHHSSGRGGCLMMSAVQLLDSPEQETVVVVMKTKPPS